MRRWTTDQRGAALSLDLDVAVAQFSRTRVGTSQVHVGRLIAASLTSIREWIEEDAA